jgi:hypothetical protein
VARLALGRRVGARTSIEDARDHLNSYLAAGGILWTRPTDEQMGTSEEATGTMLGGVVPPDTSRRALMLSSTSRWNPWRA